jgi:hypothetical protein
LAAGNPLRRIPDALAEKVGGQIAGERQQSDMFFQASQRTLDKESPGWSQLD